MHVLYLRGKCVCGLLDLKMKVELGKPHVRTHEAASTWKSPQLSGVDPAMLPISKFYIRQSLK